MKTFVASKNLGKIGELRQILASSEIDLDTYPLYAEPAEGETSYAENAALKARQLHKQLGDAGIQGAVLADDSGLEVAALDGRPGVLSARYLSADATWAARREGVLEELTGVPPDKRTAKFCCAMMLLLDDGTELTGYGEVRGVIADAERGKFGFGYDPIFLYPPTGKTFAELADNEKNRVSHRRRAADGLLMALRSRG
ncbi:MAG TPA: RdgB/HAM1 family non-canonical purine NTP pyrophosphatase [Candidatus Rubrimentiphilum sp.]|nr:RdgB/HAM1 family non-canonical purine NTP pyrophosphatase [Candidatus Rubrimentiphilum sp.]